MDLDERKLSRRGTLALASLVGSGAFVLSAGLLVPVDAAAQHAKQKRGKAIKKDSKQQDRVVDEVSATEDLMREHGVLRRTLIVYAELADRVRANAGHIDPSALPEAAKLFREFGENYHERMLEEQFIFPEVRRTGGPLEKLVETLLSQHQRGREITDYLDRIGTAGQIGSNAEPVARVLSSMTRMYNAHSAWEDTVVFPAWKKTQSKARLDDLAEKFEEIEHQQFGKDGYEDALRRIERIEQTLGLEDLSHYTAPAPT